LKNAASRHRLAAFIMARYFRSLLALAAILWICALTPPATAQTYTPKAIHFVGSPGLDAADLLRISGLHEGVPLTRAEIEAGLQKLADTGSFTDLSYTVSDAALTVKLTSAAGSRQLSVRFANFVWWQPAELERAVEARVPLYHGQLALTGSLTDSVKSALVAIAHDKGLTITVDAERSSDPATHDETIAFSIDQPAIRFGTLHIDTVRPAFGPSTEDFIAGLRGQDFDSALTTFTITHDAADIFRNAGFLDAIIDPPVFSAPRPDGPNYVVDATAAVHRGELYRVTQLQLNAAPPLSESDLRKISDLKTGDPASPMGLLISSQRIARAYEDRGFLAADAQRSTTLDNLAHKASYAISVTPGPLFHLARIDTSAMPPAVQTAISRDQHLAPGTIADAQLFAALNEDCLHATGHLCSSVRHLDRNAHTVTYTIHPGTASRVAPQPTASTE
jgi:outer membrane protein insertion porin family